MKTAHRVYTVFYHERDSDDLVGPYRHPSLVVAATDASRAIAKAKKILSEAFNLESRSIVVDEVCLDIPGAEAELMG